jgi:hypothetical protein
MGKLPPPGGSSQRADLIAFVTIAETGVLLIVVDHLTDTQGSAACAAIVGLYGAWKGPRSVPADRPRPYDGGPVEFEWAVSDSRIMRIAGKQFRLGPAWSARGKLRDPQRCRALPWPT